MAGHGHAANHRAHAIGATGNGCDEPFIVVADCLHEIVAGWSAVRAHAGAVSDTRAPGQSGECEANLVQDGLGAHHRRHGSMAASPRPIRRARGTLCCSGARAILAGC